MKREQKTDFQRRATFFRFAKLRKRTSRILFLDFCNFPRTDSFGSPFGGNYFRQAVALQRTKFGLRFMNKRMELNVGMMGTIPAGF